MSEFSFHLKMSVLLHQLYLKKPGVLKGMLDWFHGLSLLYGRAFPLLLLSSPHDEGIRAVVEWPGLPATSRPSPPLCRSVRLLLSHTIKAACQIIGFFVRLGPWRRTECVWDNKSSDKLTVKGWPTQKGAAWWSIDIGNPRTVNDRSIAELHLQFIIAWLSEAALFTVWLKYTDHTHTPAYSFNDCLIRAVA